MCTYVLAAGILELMLEAQVSGRQKEVGENCKRNFGTFCWPGANPLMGGEAKRLSGRGPGRSYHDVVFPTCP